MNLPLAQTSASPWPHRAAVLLVCATFPLIWVGGLVTTGDAGMAVPDWPNTFGYNLFLYPWKTWLFGPYDVFVEHGHRLLGALAGLLTLALAAVLWRRESRRWVRWLGLAAVVGVIGQGVLGGLRVQLAEPLLAQIHGCTGPLFFALAVALALFTSRKWLAIERGEHAAAGRLQRLSAIATALAYLQIVIGSHLRHVRPEWSPAAFRAAVWFHLLGAAVLAVHAGLLFAFSRRLPAGDGWLSRPALALAVLVGVQLSLGAGAWVANYGFPVWFQGRAISEAYLVEHHGWLQSAVTTAHVAFGSLIFATSTLLSLRGWRAFGGGSTLASAGRLGAFA